jgi:sugar O-acyltransferase (sialic acid O-acetyltransferase NeuD family)
MKDIAIFGAGGFGREIKVIIDAINKINPTYNLIGFFDDGKAKGSIINNKPVLGGLNELQNYDKSLAVAFSIAEPKVRKKIVDLISNPNIYFPNIIHPNVDMSGDEIILGKGNIICSGNILTCNITILDFTILNLQCTVGHDAIIKSYCSIMPSVSISGEVILNEGVYVGVGARVINQIEIGEYTIVGAGAVVAKSLPSNITAVGIPAKALNK